MTAHREYLERVIEAAEKFAWETEHTYLLVTKQARALVLRGLVRREMAAGYAYVERGPVELTPEGVTELQRLAVAP